MQYSEPSPNAGRSPAPARPSRLADAVYWTSRTLVLVLAKLLLRLHREGREHVPATGPTILAANHQSFLDPFLLGLATRRPCRYIARSSLANVGFARWWLRSVGTILIARGAPDRAALETAVATLRQGAVLGVFPEGTRSRDGAIADFKRGLLLLVRQTGASVVPAGISGSFEAWPPGRRLPRLRRCAVRLGPPMAAAEILAEGGLDELRQRVACLSGQALARSSPRGSSGTGSAADVRSSDGGSGHPPEREPRTHAVEPAQSSEASADQRRGHPDGPDVLAARRTTDGATT